MARDGSAKRVALPGTVNLPATRPGGVGPGRSAGWSTGRETVSCGQGFVKGGGPRPGRRRRGNERARQGTRDGSFSSPSARLLRSVLPPLARLLRSALRPPAPLSRPCAWRHTISSVASLLTPARAIAPRPGVGHAVSNVVLARSFTAGLDRSRFDPRTHARHPRTTV